MSTAPASPPPPSPAGPTELVIIAAVARNGVIGRDNDLVFKEPADQRHFRQLTMGCPVIMGRKTWESLPERFRPLPGRRNLVLSRDAHARAPGAELLPNLHQALQRVADAPRVCVIGGAQLYVAALPLVTTLELTEIDADLPGDAVFPPWPREAFVETARSPGRSADGLDYAFVTYRRR